jgi:hypothetical protein
MWIQTMPRVTRVTCPLSVQNKLNVSSIGKHKFKYSVTVKNLIEIFKNKKKSIYL